MVRRLVVALSLAIAGLSGLGLTQSVPCHAADTVPYSQYSGHGRTRLSGNPTGGHYWFSVIASRAWFWEQNATVQNTLGVCQSNPAFTPSPPCGGPGTWAHTADRMFTLLGVVRTITVTGKTASCTVLTAC